MYDHEFLNVGVSPAAGGQTARDFLAAVEQFPIVDVSTLTGGKPFLVIAPHPDDETLGCAGLMAGALERGLAFKVVVVTDGGASHPNSWSYPRPRLVELRQTETLEAASRLGIPPEQISFMGLPDSKVPLKGEVFEAATRGIVHYAREIEAASLFVTWRRDPHCDHEACNLIVRAAAKRLGAVALWAYPIWGWHIPAGETIEEALPVGVRLSIGEWLAAKREAIACHRSQTTTKIDDDPTGFVFSAAMLEPFGRPFEYFVKVDA
jgi:LmbE family N-acetylglucosaminyl deacetylase